MYDGSISVCEEGGDINHNRASTEQLKLVLGVEKRNHRNSTEPSITCQSKGHHASLLTRFS